MTENSNAVSKFIWAEKVALSFALFVALVWAATWSSAFMVIGDAGARYLWLHLGARWTNIGVIILMSAWLIMRAVDFVAGGATYRLAQQTALSVEDAFARGARASAKFAHHQEPQVAR